MKIITLFFLSVWGLGFSSLKAQTPQTYNGVFKTANLTGNANYKYFDNNKGERIYNGDFRFYTINNTANFIGQFKNNLKTGAWHFNLSNYHFTNYFYNYVVNAETIGFYNNGMMDGKWSLYRSKTISVNGGTKSNTTIENSIASFSNNHFVGGFSYSADGGKEKVIGQFDSEGLMQGIWLANYLKNGIPFEERRTYLNSVLMTRTFKDMSTGELKKDYDQEEDVQNFFKNYNIQENYSKINNKYLKLGNIEPSNDASSLIDQVLNIWLIDYSLDETSYRFEIKQGDVGILSLSQKEIITDNERNEKALEENPTNQQNTEKQSVLSDDNMVYTKVDADAEFPGGMGAFTKFLQRNLNADVPVNNGAPVGTYKVIIRFTVGKDSLAYDIQPETNFGYGMEEEAIRAIKKAPKWAPAMLNGHNVNAYKRQPITFVVSGDQ